MLPKEKLNCLLSSWQEVISKLGASHSLKLCSSSLIEMGLEVGGIGESSLLITLQGDNSQFLEKDSPGYIKYILVYYLALGKEGDLPLGQWMSL